MKYLQGGPRVNIKTIFSWKRALRGAALLAALWTAFSLLLGGSAVLIPRSAIEEHMRSAAAYYEERPGFDELGGDNSAVIHNYADAVSLNLIWSVDEKDPFRSAFAAPYYDPGSEVTSGVELAETVLRGVPADNTYGRYWHGSTVPLRVLLTVTGVQGIRMVNAVVLGMLTLIFGVLLFRRRLFVLLGAFLFAVFYCKCWVVPLCFEYVACFVIMLAFGILILVLEGRVRDWSGWFLAAGALTCYFDFLTCEILTLLVPALILMRIRHGGGENCRGTAWRSLGAWSGLWLFGYGSTWVVKWVLTALMTGQSITDIALKAGVARAVGETGVAGVGLQFVDALLVNLGRVWPMNGSLKAQYIFICLLIVGFVLLAVWYLFRGKPRSGGLAPVLLAIGALPLVRWAVLSNHSSMHPFMTFRDLIITILALAVFYEETLSISIPSRRLKQERRRV